MTDKIAVIGAGLMGHGIAQFSPRPGHPVALHDPVREDSAPRCRSASPRSSICSAQDKAGLDESPATSRISPRLSRDADFVFEAGAGEARGSSSRSSTNSAKTKADCNPLHQHLGHSDHRRSGRHLADKSRVVGTHFWNPPHLVPLVEVIQNEKTSRATVAEDHRAAARRRQSAGSCPPRHSRLRRQPPAARAEARGDRAGRRRRLRRRDARHGGEGRLRRPHGGARAAWSSPISSASI